MDWAGLAIIYCASRDNEVIIGGDGVGRLTVKSHPNSKACAIFGICTFLESYLGVGVILGIILAAASTYTSTVGIVLLVYFLIIGCVYALIETLLLYNMRETDVDMDLTSGQMNITSKSGKFCGCCNEEKKSFALNEITSIDQISDDICCTGMNKGFTVRARSGNYTPKRAGFSMDALNRMQNFILRSRGGMPPPLGVLPGYPPQQGAFYGAPLPQGGPFPGPPYYGPPGGQLPYPGQPGGLPYPQGQQPPPYSQQEQQPPPPYPQGQQQQQPPNPQGQQQQQQQQQQQYGALPPQEYGSVSQKVFPQ